MSAIEAHTFGFAIKLKGSMQVSMVGKRQRIHPQFTRAMNKPVDRTRTIKQTVMAMTVEMGE